MKICVGSRSQLYVFRGLQYSETSKVDDIQLNWRGFSIEPYLHVGVVFQVEI